MKDRHGGDWAGYQSEYGAMPLDFSMNVSPLGIPARAAAAAKAALEETEGYPDPCSRRLRHALEAYHHIPAERIVCGAGAADLLWRLVQAVRPKKALLPIPTFTEYARVLESCGCEIRTWLMTAPDFLLSGGVLEQITPDTDMLFLCEPNNPTGRRTDPALLQKILARCTEMGCLAVVDECFMEFTADADRHSCIPYLREDIRTEAQPALLVLRAFTKTYAMAGLRLGYALCGNRRLAELLRETGQPWPVSTVAEAAGIAALEEQEYREKLCSQTAQERVFLKEQLQAHGFRVVPGEANYLLFYSADPLLDEKLKKKGILIRNCTFVDGLGPGWFRIAVRGREDNRELLWQIAACMSQT